MNIKTKCVFLLLAGAMTLPLSAQDNPDKNINKNDLGAKILFRIGKGTLDLDYMNNRSVLSSFIDKLASIQSDSDYVVSELKIVGAASPDGVSEQLNIELARKRAEAIKKYIFTKMKISPSIIKIENKGENWEALRALVVASKMPYKEEVLQIMDNTPNRNQRKTKLMFLHNSVPYMYMYKNFFPVLRSGIGGTFSNGTISTECLNNWALLRDIISSSSLLEKEELLDIIDNTENPHERIQKLKAFKGGVSYDKIKNLSLEKVLYGADSLNIRNWEVLRKVISSSEMTYKKDVLAVIDTSSITKNREKELRGLYEGVPYQYIKDYFFSSLLSEAPAVLVSAKDVNELTADNYKSLVEENWKRLLYMIEYSDMPLKKELTDIIDRNTDSKKRLEEVQKLNNGSAYKNLCDVYIPVLLYSLNSLSQNNWNMIEKQVASSAMDDKDDILRIIRTVLVSMGREEQLKALKSGKDFQQIQDKMFNDMLLSLAAVNHDGTGLSLSYQLSPAAFKRLETAQRLANLKNEVEVRATLNDLEKEKSVSLANQILPTVPVTEKIALLPLKPAYWTIKTNLLYLGILLPNLEIETAVSKHMSLSIEGMCAWWSQPSAHRYYQLAALNPELRYWFGASPLKGHYAGFTLLGGLYDLENKEKGYQGEFWAPGLSYGYAFPVSKHLSFDFGFGFGYLVSQYRQYLPEDGKYVYKCTKNYHYFGPLKLKISLAWRLWKDANAKNKGGAL